MLVRNNKGLTLIEVMFALSILAVATTGLLMALVTTIQVQQDNREMDLAANAAQSVIETMRAYPTFDDIFEAYNEDTADDPVGLAPGSTLTFNYGTGALDPFLSPDTTKTGNVTVDLYATSIVGPQAKQIANELPDGAQINIQFPVNALGKLSEKEVGILLGGDGVNGMDLNGDGDTNDEDVGNGYLILPVTVQVTWTGVGGAMTYELRTYLTQRQ